MEALLHRRMTSSEGSVESVSVQNKFYSFSTPLLSVPGTHSSRRAALNFAPRPLPWKRRSNTVPLTRNQLLLSSAAAALFPTSAPAAGAHSNSPDMITLSPQPLDLEMPVDAFIDEIMPVINFFGRSHT
jgi:hypothetical protein